LRLRATYPYLLCAHPFTIAALPPPTVKQVCWVNIFIEITLPEERRNSSNFLNVIDVLTGEGIETTKDDQGQTLLILKAKSKNGNNLVVDWQVAMKRWTVSMKIPRQASTKINYDFSSNGT
jgi:hypothetical protein